jgi:hypothetical protein
VPLAIRLGTGAAILATGTIALISTAMQDFPISDPLTMIALYAALWWFLAIRPVMWLSPDELVVRNPLWTHRIARENVVSATPGFFGVVIRRRAGRPCIPVALHEPADRAASLITHWAQTPPSSNRGEAPETPVRGDPGSRTRRRVVDIAAAAAVAIALTMPALLIAWPNHSPWAGH